MTHWTRIVVRRYCGACAELQLPGAAMLVIELVSAAGRRLEKLRCQACAGPAPADLPPATITPVPPRKVLEARDRFVFKGSTHPLDFKTAAGGREPGSDDE